MKTCMDRPRDLIARYGGEEFVCLLPETDLAGAQAMAEQIRQGIHDLGIAHPVSDLVDVVTVSAGVASTIPTAHQTAEQLLAAADAQLYKAKLRGRNRTCAAGICCRAQPDGGSQ